MQDDRSKHLGRLKRVIRHLQSCPAPASAATIDQALRLGETAFRPLFTCETGGELGHDASDADLARLVFFQSPEQLREWQGAPGWYQANAVLFLRYAPVAGRLLGADLVARDVPHFLLMWDALHLLRQHNSRMRNADFDYGHEDGGAVPFASLFHRSRRFLSSRATDVNLGAAILCLAIESGLRSALAVTARESGAVWSPTRRAPMWRVFKALADEGDRVRLAVDLGLLVRLYNWASHYRHAGLRSYAWLNYFATDLLAPLFVPEAADFGPAAAFGLEADPKTLDQIRAVIERNSGSSRKTGVHTLPVRDGHGPDESAGTARSEHTRRVADLQRA